MSQNRFPDLRTQKRGPTAGAQASKERSLPSCWLYVLRKQDVAISPCANRSSELESGPTAEVTLQEQPSQIDQLCPTVSLPLVPAYWQNLKKGQLAKEPLKCDLQRPNLCITGESLERKQIKAERLQINNQQKTTNKSLTQQIQALHMQQAPSFGLWTSVQYFPSRLDWLFPPSNLLFPSLSSFPSSLYSSSLFIFFLCCFPLFLDEFQ